jgi:hypothetical protein
LFFRQAVVKAVAAKFAAEFKAVVSGDIRNVVRETKGRLLAFIKGVVRTAEGKTREIVSADKVSEPKCSRT